MADAVTDRLVKSPEALSRLGVSPRTLDKLAELGHLEKVHILGAVRYRESEIERIIASGTAEAVA